MEFFLNKLKHLLSSAGVSETVADWTSILLLVFAILVIIFVLDFIIRTIIRVTFSKIAKRSKTKFDDIMIMHQVPRNLAHIFPLIVAYKCIPSIFFEHARWQFSLEKLIIVIGIIFTVWCLRSVLGSVKDFFKSVERLKDKPIDSYIQVIMIFVWLTAVFATFAAVSGISFWEFMAGLGTVSAVIILVFKDTILSLVSSVQISSNDLFKIGDWIEAPQFGADGNVIDIALHSVKVQNWDKTICVVPTNQLINSSFKNWRGMSESGGRRIKRSIKTII